MSATDAANCPRLWNSAIAIEIPKKLILFFIRGTDETVSRIINEKTDPVSENAREVIPEKSREDITDFKIAIENAAGAFNL